MNICRKLFSLLLVLLLALCPAVWAAGEVLVEEEIAPSDEVLVEWGYDYLIPEEVSLYLYAFGELPPNYLTRDEARGMNRVSSQGNLWDIGYACASVVTPSATAKAFFQTRRADNGTSAISTMTGAIATAGGRLCH